VANSGYFNAPPVLINRGADYLDHDGVAAGKAKDYATAHLKLEPGGVLIGQIISAHDAHTAQIVAALGKLASICTASGAELRKVAAAYTHTDTTSAQKLDAAYKDPYANTVDLRQPTN
jgi:hypothetical protein